MASIHRGEGNMVGQGKRLGQVSPSSFVSITAQLVGKPYALGNFCNGMDCFNLIYRYLTMRGIPMPTEYNGLTLETYGALFQEDPDEAKRIMVEFIGSILQEIQPGMAFAGDVLLLRLKDSDSQVFLGIHGGGANVICSSCEHGVNPYPLSSYEILRAWKCQQPSR